MSTPVTPATPTTPSKAITAVSTASSVVATHHPLIMFIIVAVLAWGLAGKAEKLWSAHEQKVFDSKNAQLSAQVTANAATAASNAALAEKNAELAAQYQALLAASQKQIAALIAQTKAQQATDATLAPDALAARWESLINEADQIHPITGGYSVSQAAAVVTTQQLDGLASLQAQKVEQDQELSAANGLISGLNDQVTGLNKQVTGLQAQTVLDVATCNAQVSKVKADDAVALHKSRKKWFIAGVITGFVGGLFGGHNGL